MAFPDSPDIKRTTFAGAKKMTSTASELVTTDKAGSIYSLALLASNLQQGAPSESLPVFTIGDVAAQLQLTPRAIRFYEKRGLINPRRSGRFRLFDSKDLAVLRFIKTMRALGMGVQELTDLITNMRMSKNEKEINNILKLSVEKHLCKLEETTRSTQEKYDQCIKLLGD